MSGLTIRSSHTVNQLDEELFSEFLDTVHSFLNTYFAVRHVTVSVGSKPERESADPAGSGSFSFSGGDWLTIVNTRSADIEVRFFNSEIFGITKAVIAVDCSTTLRVNEEIEAINLSVHPDKDTPQLITVGPPVESEDDKKRLGKE